MLARDGGAIGDGGSAAWNMNRTGPDRIEATWLHMAGGGGGRAQAWEGGPGLQMEGPKGMGHGMAWNGR